MDAIKVSGLAKRYQNFTLDGISFTVPSGVIVGFIGENGAGKTTTIKAMMDLIHKDGGSVELLGHNVDRKKGNWKEEIGVVFDESYFPENLTAQDVGRIMKKVYKTWDFSKYEDYLDRFSVPEKKIFKELSRGMKMKLSLAVALSHDTKLLILDEATSGLDPVVRSDILDLFQEFIQDEEHTVFMSSHITSDVEKVADYVLVIHKGKVLLYENKDILLYEYGLIRCNQEQFECLDKSHIKGMRKNAFSYEVLVDNKNKLTDRDLVIDRVSLEDILLYLTKGEGR